VKILIVGTVSTVVQATVLCRTARSFENSGKVALTRVNINTRSLLYVVMSFYVHLQHNSVMYNTIEKAVTRTFTGGGAHQIKPEN